MAEDQIKITVGADTSQFQAELTKAENELKQFQATLKKSMDVNEIKALQTQIKATETTIANLKTSINSANPSFQKLSQGSNTAQSALTNLSRVVQDAPYGFIGIANNINPLLESFQRLKTESGSTGSALGQLASGLLGGGGLGIAIAAITSAITFAQIGFSAWSRGSKEAKESTKEFSLQTELAIQSIQSITKELDNFISVIDNATKINDINIKARFDDKGTQDALIRNSKFISISEQLVAAEEATTKAKEAFQKITKQTNQSEEDYNKILKAGLDEYNKTLDKEVELRNAREEQAASNRLATIEEKRAADEKEKAEEKKRRAAEKTKDTIEKTLAKLKEDLKDQVNIGIGLDQRTTSDQIGLIDTAIKKLISVFNVSPTDDRIVKLKLKLAKLTEEDFNKQVGDVVIGYFGKIGDLKLKPTTDIESIKEQIKYVNEAIDSLYRLQQQFGIPVDDQITPFTIRLKELNNQLKELNISNVLSNLKVNFDLSTTIDQQISLIDSTIKKLITEYNVSPTDDRIIKLQLQLDELKSKKQVEDNVKKLTDGLNNILTSAAQDIAVSFGETLGAALSGKASIGDFFSNIFEQIGKGMIAFGKFIIQWAIKIELIKKTLFKNTALAIAGGIALIALGTLLQSQMSKRQAFAVGTNYAPGGLSLVGERGPELINLPRGSQVIPAAQTSNILQGAAQQVEVYGVLRGQDIYFSNKKYSQTYRRTT